MVNAGANNMKSSSKSSTVGAAKGRAKGRMKALVITAPGINCDLELCEAFALAGCDVTSELLTRLSRDPAQIDRYDLIGLPGGFSYGDDIAAGRIMAALILLRVRGAAPSCSGTRAGAPPSSGRERGT